MDAAASILLLSYFYLTSTDPAMEKHLSSKDDQSSKS